MATAPTRPQFQFRGKRIRLAVRGSAKPDQINELLARVYGLSGCDGCGRNGYDIVIGHGDPVFDGFGGDIVQGVVVEEIASRG